MQVRTATSARVRLKDIPGYAPVIRVLATRDLKSRYKQSLFGPAWVLFQPLALLIAFTIGFRHVAHVNSQGVPYALYALAGLTVWTYFQAGVMASTPSIINNLPLVKYTACPRLALPIAALFANLPSLVVTGAATVIACVASGYLHAQLALLPLLVVWTIALVSAFAITLGSLTVRARDVGSVLPFLLQVALFLSPVAYGISSLSPTLRTIISLNPLTGLIEAWRWVLLGLRPGTLPLLTSAGITLAGLLLAWIAFRSSERAMADEI
jgi:ABC-type polysaccharide/polyol phosphate export permease